MMFSSSVARRIAVNANNTRHNAAATVRSKHRQKLTSSSTTKRSLVSLTQPQQQSQPSVQYYGIDRTAQPLIWCPNTQFVPTKQHQTHHQQKQPKRYMSSSDLPYHLVVGMPALSPTMSSGSISKWNVKEGDTFVAGDSLALIETDKASMDFEAQDDGVVAKLLVAEGGGEIECGTPIMVTVEEEGDVASFANFVADASPAAAVESAPDVETPPVAVSTPPPVATPAAPVAAAAPTPTPAAVAAAPVTTTTPSAPLDAISLGGSTWGKLAAEKSPLAKLLASKQKQYIAKYGSTGHIPIV